MYIVILFALLINFTLSQTGELCFKNYDTLVDKSIIKSEYQYVDIRFGTYIKRKCRSENLTMIWYKDSYKEIKRKILKKKQSYINYGLEFYSLLKSDSGNYTLLIYNKIFSFTYNVTLFVLNGSESLRVLRQYTVPLDNSYIIKDQLYWMPKMIESKRMEIISSYDQFAIKCMFYRQIELKYVSVNWYLDLSGASSSDSLGERLENTSMVYYIVKTIPCDIDLWMPQHKGFCYSAELHFVAFFAKDTGRYTCVINNNLKTSFLLLIQVNDFRSEPKSESVEQYVSEDNSNVTLSFNKNSTICEESEFLFQCSVNMSNSRVMIFFVNNSKETLLASGEQLVIYKLRMAEINDSGEYICKSSKFQSKYMYLKVEKCLSTLVFWYICLTFLTILFLVVLIIFIVNRIEKIRQRLYLRNKIHSMSKLSGEGLYRNERYIPLQSDSSWEIPQGNFTVTPEVLGVGEFGVVSRGRFRNKEVAVKTAKLEGFEMLVQEIEILKTLGYHQNVIQLLGVCSSNGQLLAILELANEGNLRQYLRDHNPSLNPSCEQVGMELLLSYVTQIATGMQYLASKNVIHRDLAARNCLLTSDSCIKLSDFGLTRVATNYYLSQSQGVRAIAWAAPESILTNTFTSKSDVWSFGIVLWEVYELGACPYPSMTSSEIIEAVTQGVVNAQPSRASDDLYAIMIRCWAKESADRPTFVELKEYLDEVDVNEYL